MVRIGQPWTSTQSEHIFGAATRLTTLVLAMLAGITHTVTAEQVHEARQASLTVPTVTLSTSTIASGSGSGSGSGTGTRGTSTNSSVSPIATTTTVLATSTGPNGTTTFLTTVTTLIVPGTATGNSSTSTTSTSTAYPSLNTYSTCVDNCLMLAVSTPNCSSITDTACYCSSSDFTSTLFSCISDQCNDELSSAERLAQAFCNVASPSVSLSFPTSSASGSGNVTSSATSTSTSASATGNAAVRLGSWEGGSSMGLAIGLGMAGTVLSALLC